MSSCVSRRKKASTADCLSERLGRRKGRRGTARGIVNAKFKQSMKKRSEDGSFSEGNQEKKKRQSEGKRVGWKGKCRELKTELWETAGKTERTHSCLRRKPKVRPQALRIMSSTGNGRAFLIIRAK